jgi:hypothetical protein
VCVTYKGSFKGKGKGAPWAKGKGKPKGTYQGLLMHPTMRPPSGAPVPHNPSSTSSSTLTNSSGKGTQSSTSAAPTVRCHFCNKLGHYKNNCRQYQALQKQLQAISSITQLTIKSSSAHALGTDATYLWSFGRRCVRSTFMLNYVMYQHALWRISMFHVIPSR